MGTTWTGQQTEIFNFFTTGRGNLVVRARAGTGKTTTILEASGHAPESKILFAAFGKAIAEELKGRIKKGQAQTLHSLGFACVRYNWRRIKLDNKRGISLAERVTDKHPVSAIVAKLASYAKGTLARDVPAVMDLAFRFDCLPDDDSEEAGWTVEKVAQATLDAMNLACEYDGTIDYDDMCFLPVAMGWRPLQFDLVIVDEAQDMNPVQLELAKKSCSSRGRIVVVGDDRQAIYAFRGADSEAIDRLKRELNAEELGLNVTFRCGKAIVDVAQRLVPDFEAGVNNPDGIVRSIVTDTHKGMLTEQAQPGDFVLSRKNAPLARICLALLRNGTKATIKGRDIGAGLVRLIERLSKPRSVKSLSDLLVALNAYEQRETDKAIKADRPERADFIADQVETIHALSEGVATISELISRFETLFTDNGDDSLKVVCSSIHRAKGLEADRVFVAYDTLYPGGRDGIEEQNLEYVAVTRAKRELVWFDSKTQVK